MENNSTEKNKVVIVTGANGNLGQAVVQKFLTENYLVFGTETKSNNQNSPVKNLEKTVVDLSNENAAANFVNDVIKKHDAIDVAVLTAGGFAMAKVEGTKASDILDQYKINFETAYNIAKPAFLQMLKQGSGRIFLIGSKPGLNAKDSKGMIAYGLSKSLIFRLAELMNDEATGTNVVVSVVVPSTIDTPPNRKAMPDAVFNKWVKPEAIADVIYWHCTNEAAALRESIIKVYNHA